MAEMPSNGSQSIRKKEVLAENRIYAFFWDPKNERLQSQISN
jgi:hypothetical protein